MPELDRTASCEHEERALERIRPTRGRDVGILHRFEERRLRFRRRPIDLVGEDDLREDRPGHEPESAVSVGLVEHLGAGDVGGHQVGRELDPLERQVENLRDRLDEQCLGESRHAGDQAMPAGEERDEDLIDDRILPDDDLADLDRMRSRPSATRWATAAMSPEVVSVVAVGGRVVVCGFIFVSRVSGVSGSANTRFR